MNQNGQPDFFSYFGVAFLALFGIWLIIIGIIDSLPEG